jgi:hypothetical protein
MCVVHGGPFGLAMGWIIDDLRTGASGGRVPTGFCLRELVVLHLSEVVEQAGGAGGLSVMARLNWFGCTRALTGLSVQVR